MARKKIVLMGLTGIHNYGDNFIAHCTEYLVKASGDYDVEMVNLASSMPFYRAALYGSLYLASLAGPNTALSAGLVKFAVKIRCRKIYRKALNNADALIFACGSFKYGTQKLWAYYSLATDLANERSIPVMFNAMNIQKYNAGNPKCSCLRDHANLPCVRVITSRDGDQASERLYRDYRIRKDILCTGAGDSAFWIPEAYQVQKKKDRAVIGINLIRGNVFKSYGNTLSEGKLLDAYCELLRILDEERIPWELFTNGMKCDYKFGRKLLAQYGNKKKRIVVPKSDTELAERISGYHTVLGARLHACICAYALDIPYVGFIWDEKLQSFAEMTGTTEYVLREEDMSGEKLSHLILKQYRQGSIGDPELKSHWKGKTKQLIEEFLENIVCEN